MVHQGSIVFAASVDPYVIERIARERYTGVRCHGSRLFADISSTKKIAIKWEVRGDHLDITISDDPVSLQWVVRLIFGLIFPFLGWIIFDKFHYKYMENEIQDLKDEILMYEERRYVAIVDE